MYPSVPMMPLIITNKSWYVFLGINCFHACLFWGFVASSCISWNHDWNHLKTVINSFIYVVERVVEFIIVNNLSHILMYNLVCSVSHNVNGKSWRSIAFAVSSLSTSLAYLTFILVLLSNSVCFSEIFVSKYFDTETMWSHEMLFPFLLKL